MADGQPGKSSQVTRLQLGLLTCSSPRKPLRIRSEQGSTCRLFCCILCLRDWPSLAVHVSLRLSPPESKDYLLTPLSSRYRCFKLVGLHPLCAIIFAAGYGLREYGAFNYMYSNRNLIIYILSQVFIFICP